MERQKLLLKLNLKLKLKLKLKPSQLFYHTNTKSQTPWCIQHQSPDTLHPSYWCHGEDWPSPCCINTRQTTTTPQLAKSHQPVWGQTGGPLNSPSNVVSGSSEILSPWEAIKVPSTTNHKFDIIPLMNGQISINNSKYTSQHTYDETRTTVPNLNFNEIHLLLNLYEL